VWNRQPLLLGAETVADTNANLDDESIQKSSERLNGSLSKHNVHANKLKTCNRVDNKSHENNELEHLTALNVFTTLESASVASFKIIDNEHETKGRKSKKRNSTKTNTNEQKIYESPNHLNEVSTSGSSSEECNFSDSTPQQTGIPNTSKVIVSDNEQSTIQCQPPKKTSEMAKSKLESPSISNHESTKEETNHPVCLKRKNASFDLDKGKFNQSFQQESKAQDHRSSSTVRIWQKFCLVQTPFFLHRLSNSMIYFFWRQVVSGSYCVGRSVVSVLTVFFKVAAVLTLALGNIVKYAMEESLSMGVIRKFIPFIPPTNATSPSSGMTPFCYLAMYCTPTLCDWIMDHFDLPHFAPHIISNGILFTLCFQLERQCFSDKTHNIIHSMRGKTENGASGKKHEKLQTRQLSVVQRNRFANDLSYSILRTIRWEAIPLAFLLEGFSEKNSTIMLLDSSTRLTIAFLLSATQNDNLLSPLLWMGWAIQVLFAAYLPHAISLDIILLLTGMAFIRLVSTLESEI
jgi:hypothetical protein